MRAPEGVPAAKPKTGVNGIRELLAAANMAPGALNYMTTEELERLVNRGESRVRSGVEHVFAVVKKLWGFTKVRYRGLAKNGTRAFVVAALANLFLARKRLLA